MHARLKPSCWTAVVLLALPVRALPQTADIQAELARLAATDAELAAALERSAAARDSGRYTHSELQEHLRIDWLQYRLSPGAQDRLTVEARGGGSVGSVLGSTVVWVDKRTGETKQMAYEAQSSFLPDMRLAMDVTIEQDGQAPATKRYMFDDLGPVSVVLRELDDGTRHIARFVPELDPKTTVQDYGDALTIRLASAALLVDDEYAGEFTATGQILGITSGRAGMRFEFGLKPFAEAAPIGRTDGRTIQFDYAGHHYRLYSTEPITMIPQDGTQWNVYVRGESVSAAGTGTTTRTYDTARIQAVVDTLLP